MMAYVDENYYKNEFKGSIIPDNELDRQLEKASDHIDSLTFNRILAIGFENLTEFQKTRVKKAVCFHAEFIYQYGAYLDIPISGYSAGSVSLSFKAIETAGGIRTSEDVIRLMMPTGLMDRRLR